MEQEKNRAAWSPSKEQAKTVALFLGAGEKRTLAETVLEAGGQSGDYWAWCADANFVDYFNRQADLLFRCAEGFAAKALLQRLEAGELAAVKLFFEQAEKREKKGGMEVVLRWEQEE